MIWKSLHDLHYQCLKDNFNALRECSFSIGVEETELRNLAECLEYCEEQEQVAGVQTNQEYGARILFPPEEGFSFLREQRLCIEQSLQQGGIFLVLSGLGVGHSVQMACQLIDSSPRAVILVYEKNPWAWAAFLSFFPIANFLASRRVFFFGGEFAAENMLEFVNKNYLFLLKPDECKYMLGAVPAPSVDSVAYIQDARGLAKAILSLMPAFDEKFDQFTVSMARPIQKYPRTVWSCSNPAAYIHHPIAEAFSPGFCSGWDGNQYGFV